jgi:hypothetical protein
MRHLLALFAVLGLLFVSPALAQFAVQETLITAAASTEDTVSAQRAEHPSAKNTIWYFKLDLTAIDGAGANGVTMSVEYYDYIDTEWDTWMTGCTQLTAIGECVMIFTSAAATDHASLVSTGSNDINVVHLVPMPGVWRVAVRETTGAPTATYTVTHWRH